MNKIKITVLALICAILLNFIYIHKGDLRQTLSRHTVILEFFEKTSGGKTF